MGVNKFDVIFSNVMLLVFFIFVCLQVKSLFAENVLGGIFVCFFGLVAIVAFIQNVIIYFKYQGGVDMK